MLVLLPFVLVPFEVLHTPSIPHVSFKLADSQSTSLPESFAVSPLQSSPEGSARRKKHLSVLRDLFKGTGSSGATKRSSHPLKRASSGRSALNVSTRSSRSISPFIETDLASSRSLVQRGEDGSGSANTSPGAVPRRRIVEDVDDSVANSSSFGSPALMSGAQVDSAGTSSAATLTSMDSIRSPEPVMTASHAVSTNGGFQDDDVSSAPDVQPFSSTDVGARFPTSQGSDSVSGHSSPPNNAPLSSSQPEFTVPAPPPPPVLDEADQLPSDPPSTTARGGTVEIGLLKRDITSLEKAIQKIESQLKKLDNWFFEQMAAETSAADRPPSSSTTASPSSEVSIKQTYKKRNSELKRQLTEMQTRLSDTRYVVHHLETHGLPEGVAAKIFIRRLLADRRKDERSAVGGESSRVSGSPKKSGKSRHASPLPTSTPPEAKHGKTRSGSPPPAISPNDRSVGVTNTGSSPSSGPSLTTVGMSPSRSFATLPASRPASITAENATATVRARTLPSTSTATSLTTSSEAEAIAAAWAACKSIAPPALVDATNSAKATRIKPTPVSPSNSAAALLATATAMASNTSSGVDSHYHPHYTPHQPHLLLTDAASQPSHFVTSPSATGGHAHKQLPLFDHLGADLGSGTPGKVTKKPRTSMKSAFRFLGRPFRRSGNALPIQRSLSEEHIAGHSVLGDALLQSSDSLSGKLNKSPSTTNTRAIIPGRGSPSLPSALGLMTDPRGKKNRNHGNGATDQHSYPSHQDTPVQGKRSQAGSLSSAGAGGPSGSIHQAAVIDPTTEGGSHRSGASIDNPALTRILEVLSGSFSQPSSGVGALPPLTSSGSSQSGRMPPLTVATGVAAAGVAAAGQSPSPVSIPGPATTLQTPVASVALNNVAAALVLLYHHCEALFDQRDLALQNLGEEVVGLRKGVKECRDAVNVAMAEIEALRRDIKTGEELQKQQLTNATSRLEQLDVSAEELRQNFRQDMAAIRKEQRRALEPLEYQLATKTRDLQDILTTLNNKFNIMEKSVEQLASPSRDQPRARQLFVHTLTDLGVSFFAFITALIQILIRFLNAGATVTQNRVSAIVLNISLLCVFLAVFLWEPVSRRWRNDT
ncbi:hypothetical protein SprV_0200699800 [Sparganum proliferum]